MYLIIELLKLLCMKPQRHSLYLIKIRERHLPFSYFNLNEDFKETVLLNTNFSGVVYLESTLKKPFLTIWNLS